MRTNLIKTIAGVLLATVAFVSAKAQGTITIDNFDNFDTSSTASSGGLFFLQTQPNTATLYNGPALNMELLGGSNASNLAEIATLSGTNAAINIGPGYFGDPAGTTYQVPGVPLGNTAYLQLEVWIGNYATFASAQAAEAPRTVSTVFQNRTGGEGVPPVIPSELLGMPAIIITPEPTTLVLGSMAGVTLLLVRRRK